MKSLDKKLAIACEMVRDLKIENQRLKEKVGNQRKQLREFNRLEKEGREAILAEETRIRLAARMKKREYKRVEVVTEAK